MYNAWIYELSWKLIDTTYAVGDPAFGRAVLFFFCVSVFALYECKNPGAPWAYRYNGKYHAAAGEKAFECGTA